MKTKVVCSVLKTVAIALLPFATTGARAQSSSLATPLPSGTTSLPRIERPSRPGKLPSLAISFMTSKYERDVDFRNMKSSSKDETGGSSESSTLPNRNYMSVAASLPFLESHRVTILGFKNLDGEDARTVVTPTGARFTLPGEAIGIRYQHSFTESTTIEARTMRSESGDFHDPSLSLGYNELDLSGVSQRYTLSASIPTTEKSREDDLITKASVRGFFGVNLGNWSLFTSAVAAKSFYRGTPPEGGRFSRAQKPSAPETGTRSDTGTRSAGTPPVLDEVDQALMEREIERAGLNLGANYTPFGDLRLTSSLGASRALTQKDRTVWTTNARLIAATYALGACDISGDLSLFSDAENFRGLSTPNVLGIGFRVTYTFGEKTRVF